MMKRNSWRRASALLLLAAAAVIGVSCNLIGPTTPPEINVPSLHQLAPHGMPIGVAVPAGKARNSLLLSPERQAIVNQHFNQLTAENIMKPMFLRPRRNRFSFTDADALVSYAADQGMTVHGHTLVWHQGLPAWMVNYEGDAADWSKLMRDHITGIVSHYAEEDIVVSWDVLNEVVSDIDADEDGTNDLRRSVWLDNLGTSYLAAAYRVAHAADPNAELYYNDYNIAGIPAKLNAVLDMIGEFQADPDPVPIHGIAFQMHVRVDWPEISQIRESLARAVATGLKIKISELDMSVNTDRRGRRKSMKELTVQVAVRQQKRIEQIVTAYMEVVPPAQRGGISVWGIADSDSWHRMNDPNEWPLLFDDEFKPKPALQGLADGLARDKHQPTKDMTAN
ncbi:MAG: endo-1,4-beta-xylanase [Woeseiaceae bacterium]|nr:endo-1,4-beta-xylanase [Woeseiaceae bacterium]